MTAFDVVFKGERFRPMLQAVGASGAVGKNARMNIVAFMDSNGGNSGVRDFGDVLESNVYPRGYTDGLMVALHRRGINIVGGPVHNQCAGPQYQRFNPMGVFCGYEDDNGNGTFPATPVGSFVASESFPYNDQSFNGHLIYINGTTASNPTNLGSNSPISYLGMATQLDPNGTWVNPQPFGNETAQVRFNFSYKTPSSSAVDLWMSVRRYNNAVQGSLNVTAGTNGAWVRKSILCNATGAGNFGYSAHCFNHNANRSTGPVAVSGLQWTHSGIDPTSPNTGPAGAAVTPMYFKFGNTISQTASDLKAAGTPALAHALWDCVQEFGWLGIGFFYTGNDATSSAASFQYGDTPGSPTGPACNTAAGFVTGFTTMLRLIYDALASINFDMSKLVILGPMYHSQTVDPVKSLAPQFAQAIRDAVAAGTQYFDRVVVVDGTRAMPPAEIESLGLYNDNPQPISSITTGGTTNPVPVFTMGTTHNLTDGKVIELSSTTTVPVLHAPTSPGKYFVKTGDNAGANPTTKFRIFTDPAFTTSVAVGTASPGGTAGYVRAQPNLGMFHFRPSGNQAFMAACLNALLAAADLPGTATRQAGSGTIGL